MLTRRTNLLQTTFGKNLLKLFVRLWKIVLGFTSDILHNMPGRNYHVRDLCEESRHAFFLWKHIGAPRNEIFADSMHRKKAVFKVALRRCRANENSLRA